MSAWPGFAAAGLTAASVVLHVLMVVDGGHGAALGIVLAVMAVSCAGCAVHSVLRPGCRGSLALVGMSITMALAHAVIALGVPGGMGIHAVHDGGSHLRGAGAAGAEHGQLMLLVIGVELAVAWLAAYAVHRARAGAGVRGRMRA
ncbi:hypothetical protein GCM10009596_02810 [Arthrobacter rhombi]|uniref:hypothetical protein n=1 Tax=Arthrobacter rhombi TaxID=71253 RepID=UPI0031D8EF48